MKLINKFKSPNYDKRKNDKIKFIIIHYTALKDYKKAISHLCDKKNKVSSHFLISQEGKIYALVDEKYRAWHAGVSFWNNLRDINSYSIGIELDFSSHKSNNNFTNKMMQSLKNLLAYLIKKYSIKKYDILAHSDVAPLRKYDPGPNFPWHSLSKSNLAFIPNKKSFKKISIIKQWFKKNKFSSRKNIALFILFFIGYDISTACKNRVIFKKLIICYQSHYLQKNITGKIDTRTVNFLILHFFNLVLTKNKIELREIT